MKSGSNFYFSILYRDLIINIPYAKKLASSILNEAGIQPPSYRELLIDVDNILSYYGFVVEPMSSHKWQGFLKGKTIYLSSKLLKEDAAMATFVILLMLVYHIINCNNVDYNSCVIPSVKEIPRDNIYFITVSYILLPPLARKILKEKYSDFGPFLKASLCGVPEFLIDT